MKEIWDIRLPQLLALPILFVALFFTSLKSIAQECPLLLNPTDGAISVPVNSPITWESVTGVPGYIISLGTTAGGNDIVNERNVGTSTSFSPPTGLPENTEIFVTITLFFFNQPNIVCDIQSFTTAALTEVPDCVPSTLPSNNANNINTSTNISWSPASGAFGYILSIGTTLNGSEILNNLDMGNNLSYNPPTDLPSEANIFVNIIPYNSIGMATGCNTIFFTTAEAAILPQCTSMITPFDGETKCNGLQSIYRHIAL